MHKINRVTNSRNKILLKIIIVFTVLFVNLTLLKPSFSQANVEYYNLSGDTSTRGAISIAFPEGWSTYWKFPGPNGFIPKIRVLTEKNLESFSISWPYPKKLGPKNFTYLGYDDDLLLPIEIKKLDKRKKIHLHLDISFGICKSVCVVQNKTLEISDEGDLNYLVLDKLLKSKNRIAMTTSFGSSNKCIIKKKTDKEYQITIENNFMRNNELVSGVLVDYKGSSWIIETQSFYPEIGRVKALLKAENISRNDISIDNFSLLYLDGKIAKKTIGCPS